MPRMDKEHGERRDLAPSRSNTETEGSHEYDQERRAVGDRGQRAEGEKIGFVIISEGSNLVPGCIVYHSFKTHDPLQLAFFVPTFHPSMATLDKRL